MPSAVLITGSRSVAPEAGVRRLDAKLNPKDYDLLIDGDCKKGGDVAARLWAERHGIQRLPRPANWDRFGKSAGFIRNGEMVSDLVKLRESGWTVVCVSIWDGVSGGTRDCFSKAIENEIKVIHA